jgi:diphthine-ammonia ligase
MQHLLNTEMYVNVQIKSEFSSIQPCVACYQDMFFCSWSGGKDSSLALYRAIKAGGCPCCLLTMMIETGERSRSHGIPKNVLEEQARCLGIPIRFCSTSWQFYTEQFLENLNFFKDLEIEKGVFGDIDIESHRQWVENVCNTKKITAWLPLWQEPRTILLDELISAGFRAEIVAVKEGVLSPHYLGKILNNEILEEFKILGIDLCGEAGEYHTIVTDGPIFKQPLHIIHGKQVLKDGCWFSDVSLNLNFY